MIVYCQNFDKHRGKKPVLCDNIKGKYICPTCNEEVEVDPRIGSWPRLEGETRAGYPKSMIRKM